MRNYSFLSVAIFGTLSFLAVLSLPHLAITSFPSARSVELKVTYSWPETPARILEQEVTSPIESLVSSVRGVQKVASVSFRGGGYVQMTIKENVDIDRVRFEIKSKLRQLIPLFPEGVTYPQLKMGESDGPSNYLLSLYLYGHSEPYAVDESLLNNLRSELGSILGVHSIVVEGRVVKEVEIDVSRRKAELYNVLLSDVETVVREASSQQQSGKGWSSFLGDEMQESSIIVKSPLWTVEELRHLPLRKIDSRIIVLSDVATIRIKEKESPTYFRLNGQNTIKLSVYARQGTNTFKLAEEVRSKAQAFSKTLPWNWSIKASPDSSVHLLAEYRQIVPLVLLSLMLIFFILGLVLKDRKSVFVFLVLTSVTIFISSLIVSIFRVELHFYSFAVVPFTVSSIALQTAMALKGPQGGVRILSGILLCVGSLVIVLVSGILPLEVQTVLEDFFWILTIGTCMSILTCTMLLPSLLNKFTIAQTEEKPGKTSWFMNRKVTLLCKLISRFRVAVLLALFILFGIPINLLPERLHGDGILVSAYNNTIGSVYYQENVKGTAEGILGGAVRLFFDNVLENSYSTEAGRPRIKIVATMRDGSTTEHMNDAVGKMEKYLQNCIGIEMFECQINSGRHASITLTFKDDFEEGPGPMVLKSKLESKAVELGGATWEIYGVGIGFSNAIHDGVKSNRIVLEGYNYDDLLQIAGRLRDTLQTSQRVREATIHGPDYFISSPSDEQHLTFQGEELARSGITPTELALYLQHLGSRKRIARFVSGNELTDVTLIVDGENALDKWSLKNGRDNVNGHPVKFTDAVKLNSEPGPMTIHRIDQQYRLFVSFSFVGPQLLSKKVQASAIQRLSRQLPVGYLIYSDLSSLIVPGDQIVQWNRYEANQYLSILMVMTALFVISASFLESVRMAAIMLLMSTFSVAGVVICFSLMNTNFDEGAFAGLLLLPVLATSVSFQILKRFKELLDLKNRTDESILYAIALNSCFLDFLVSCFAISAAIAPFLILSQSMMFWCPFAVAILAGLAFQFLGLFCVLPLIVGKKSRSLSRIA